MLEVPATCCTLMINFVSSRPSYKSSVISLPTNRWFRGRHDSGAFVNSGHWFNSWRRDALVVALTSAVLNLIRAAVSCPQRNDDDGQRASVWCSRTWHHLTMPDSDVAIRPEAPGDEEAIDEVVRDAFMQQFGSDSEVLLVRNLRDRGELVPDLTLVAVRNSRVVGFIAFSEISLDGKRAKGLGLAPVAVAPGCQGDGIGAALIRSGLRRATAADWQFVVLLGHEHYYPRFEFVPAAPLGVRGDYGDGPSWMIQPLADTKLVPGHIRYSTAFLD